MLYVKEANTMLQKKKEKVEKENKVKKEAVEKLRAAERKNQKKGNLILNYYLLDSLRKNYLLDFSGSHDQICRGILRCL